MTTKKNYIYIIALILILGLGIFLIYYLEARGGSDRTPDISASFSPGGGISKQIIKEINNSKLSIDIAMYSFTKSDIAQALVNARKRGVIVRIIMDDGRSKTGNSKFRYFLSNNVNQKLVEPTMHNKFAVIDGKLLITGSYNWTNSAEKRNFENILFIRNSPEVIKKYEEQFEGLWRIGNAVSR